ncbi:hypothetical protein C8F04DRAFT_1256031 [Mycena alexandri]|uniref:Uncharacterized protein n=1 Tax=Mycena alexandri TaxID=1745969 RepID=A0AAD6T3C1_9AGAR|nr:hypothetical protein C8F04DRAFT_1256031 [Mycena alexandri]
MRHAGKRSWVFGLKVAFFEAHKEKFLAAVELKTTGAFYHKVGQLYLAKYGYALRWDEDLDEGQDVADDVDPDEDVNDLVPAEAETRAKKFKKLREKLGVWYHGQYGHSIPKKGKKMPSTKLFDKPELEPPAPVKPRVLHYYSRNFYETRVKSRVKTRWAALLRLDNPPKPVTVRNMVTREAWGAETQEFRDKVVLALEKEHDVAVKAYTMAVSGDAPTSPQEYSVALNDAAYYLQPFVNAIHEQFGMNVASMMCGPIADCGGRIEVRSVHSGTSNGLVPRIWSDFDRGGFDMTQRSFLDFSHHCFTEEECRRRALNRDNTSADGAVQSRGTTPTRDDVVAASAPWPRATGDSAVVNPAQPRREGEGEWMMPLGTGTTTPVNLFTEEEWAALEGNGLNNPLFDTASYNADGSLLHGMGGDDSDVALQFGQLLGETALQLPDVRLPNLTASPVFPVSLLLPAVVQPSSAVSSPVPPSSDASSGAASSLPPRPSATTGKAEIPRPKPKPAY